MKGKNFLSALKSLCVELPLPSFYCLSPYISGDLLSSHFEIYTEFREKFESQTSTCVDIECVLNDCSDTALYNLASQVYNHDLYFSCLTLPEENKYPAGSLGICGLIEESFGSFSNFEKEMKDLAINHPGNWVYLNYSDQGKLEIVEGDGFCIPIVPDQSYPILNIDLWEHSYYQQYGNNIVEYVENWFNIIDWVAVNSNVNDLDLRFQGNRDLKSLMSSRRSCRVFEEEKKVPKYMIDSIVEVSHLPPSAGDLRGFSIVVVEDSEAKSAIRSVCEQGEKQWIDGRPKEVRESIYGLPNFTLEKKFLDDASHLLVFACDPSFDGFPYSVESAWLSIGYCLLEIERLGLGTLTYTPSIVFTENAQELNDIVNLPDEEVVQVILPVGYVDMDKVEYIESAKEQVKVVEKPEKVYLDAVGKEYDFS